ncbi:MAG: hemagglutinin repeat-containing protein, partial [Pseudomonas sp.]
MDVRSPFFQNVATVLVGVMFLNPIVGAAAELTVAAGSNATLGQAGNGVPVVNIAAPNGNGLSHNTFKDYNVGQQGLILNNATSSIQSTQLGGIILGNSNLNGRAAGLILNEVTGANASRLQGYTEVAGQSAHVIVANPHGISCDGCGFINTPRVTLSTGTPIVENGRLDRFDINGGSIAIEGRGLNASNVDQFDLITRSAKINAELHANRLNIITGRNEVKADDLSVTAKAPDSSDQPLLAIDSSALGGMYAGAIRLVGTEAGVGVKLAGDMAASAGDIRIDANGQLSVGRAAATRDISLKAQAVELERATYAGRDANIEAGTLSNQVSLATGGDLTITARQIDNAQDAVLETGIRADGGTNAAATLTVTGEDLDNAGDIVAHGALNTELKALNNRGTVVAAGEASVTASMLDNQGGTLIGQQSLSIVAERMDNRAGTVASNGALNVALSGDLDNRDAGLLLSKGSGLTVAVQTLHNQSGNVQADSGALTVTASTLNNADGGIVAVQGELNLDASTTHNHKGTLQGSTVTLTGQTLNNSGSLIASKGQAQLTLDTLSNANGTLLAATDLSITATDLNNGSGELGANAVDLALSGQLDNDDGLIESATVLDVAAAQASNVNGKLRALGSSGHSQFNLGRLFDNTAGLIEIGNAAFSLGVASLKNQGGTVRHLGTAGLNIGMDTLGSAGGSFMTHSALVFNADEWTNTSQIQAGRLDLAIKRLTQTSTGALLAIDSLDLAGNSWINDGRIETDGDLVLTLAGDYSGNGALLAQNDLTLNAANISVGQNGALRSGGVGTFTAAQAFNNAGVVTSTTGLELNAASMLNQGTLGSSENLRIVTPSLSNIGGLIFSGANMDLFANQLTNRKADIYSLGNLLVAANSDGDKASRFSNLSGTVESAGWMSVAASVLENARETLDISSSKYAARLYYVGCTDCSGTNEDGLFKLEEIDRTTATNVSPQAQLLAGGDMSLASENLSNRYSLIASGGDLRIDTEQFNNQGAQTGTVLTSRQLKTHRVRAYAVEYQKEDANNFTNLHWHTSPNFTSVNIERDLNAFFNKHVEYTRETYEPVLSDVQYYHATVQAAGGVKINASQQLNNSVIKASFAYVAGGTRNPDTTTPGSSVSTQVTLNPQLPPDLMQQVVDPLTLPGFSLPQGQNGMFHFNPSGSHNYLIETNPAFANLGNFLNSDYMLGQLGYDTDVTQKRLGDGFYEQRLIREAIVARTGQRYLAGLTSDEAMFRYLMDNAIASKDALGLSLGVSLSAEQVAALTHDIVWMEEREVMGEKVLVPMLYLAQAEGRLAPTGALIQGRDITLISGGDLANQGTLRASQNLDITASNITNSGLMQANERLSLLAEGSIRNAQGGIIAGRDVSLLAGNDIHNERSVSVHQSAAGSQRWVSSFADSAARIEASGDLSLAAGRDVINLGGVLDSRGDLGIDAGRDVSIAAVQNLQHQSRGGSYLDEQVTQLGAEVSAGRDLAIGAGRDLGIIASQVTAGRDLDLGAERDLAISSAADESHYLSRSKKVTQSNDRITQQSSEIQAGRDLSLGAGNDLSVIASRVTAANDVDLDAGQDINILSAKDESASFYFKKKKGSFGRSSSKQQESYDSTNIASVIEAGNDLTINTSKTAEGGLSLDGGRDVTVIGSQLSAGNDLLLGATGDIAVLSGVEEHGSYSKKTKSGFLGLSKSGKSQLKTTASQVASELSADNDVVIAAGNDVRLRASTTAAGNDVELRAGLIDSAGDINLVSANDEAYSRSESYKKKVGLSFSDAVGLAVGTPSWGGDIAISSAKKRGQEIISSTNVGSQVSAERDASLIAERDINVVGSGVSAGRNVLLDAGRDVNVVAGTGSEQVTSWKNTKTVGLQQSADGNGFTTFVGAESLKDKIRTSEQTAAASQIDAGLDLDVRAGRDILQQGSDLSAGYDLNMQAGRDIRIDAANEQWAYAREQSQKRTGTSTTVNHNFANTKDAISGAGKGENTVSQASGVLKAVDGVGQFMSGPTFDGHIGSTSQSQSVSQSGTTSRGSTLGAGHDISLIAGDRVVVKGSELQSGRDINVTAQDILLDVARGEQRYEQEQTQGKGGIVGGTTGGFKVGIGGSHGSAKQEGSQGTASATQLQAGRDIHLDASNDLSLIGTEAWAGRDIDLSAGNDLLISAAGNTQDTEEKRRSGGGEVGLTFGSGGIGVYASVNLGKGNLEREGERQQEAYLYAGNRLSFDSGQDTTITGAQLRGNEVTGRVGGDLLVTSLPDTGEVQGREFDLSATVTVGPG